MRRMMAGLVVVTLAAGAAIVAWRAESEGGSSTFDENYPTANTISCASATACLAVGSAERGTPRTSVPVVQAFNAGTWRTVAVKAPGKPGSRTTLTGVSCPAAGYCLAVGEYDPGDRGLPRPYAMSWDGASLSPAVRLPLPTASDLEEMGGVSCPAVNRCVVTGNVPRGEIIWTWNGSAWSMMSVPTPDTVADEYFDSVQCTTVTDCMVAGRESAGSSTVPAAASWNGRSFTRLRPPAPTGMSTAGYSGLSCATREHCAFTGLGYASHGSPITSFLEMWNGRTWKLTTWRGPKAGDYAELSAVSCRTANDCVAVGSDGPDTGQRAAALTWDGANWKAARVPGPGPGKMSVFYGVSCAKTGGCTAIGERGAIP
ncbi:hypothetical protein EAS64_12490 [Trebonia kvetii]|uniref:Ig-like domain-containing protein n=1 Tax=Trebonia kvetii TaxID=2480626 RepID=A0A6P2C4E6_9ACTN|nr:hypothetical protein [Trebonia kvetii]TVZ05375.1 hypothetical protein EAS64_12490 [Trebonia kvetii]